MDLLDELLGVLPAGVVDETDVPLVATEPEQHSGDEHENERNGHRAEHGLGVARPLLEVLDSDGEGAIEVHALPPVSWL